MDSEKETPKKRVDIPDYLYNADTDCEHNIVAKELWQGGGVYCTKCNGWFCY